MSTEQEEQEQGGIEREASLGSVMAALEGLPGENMIKENFSSSQEEEDDQHDGDDANVEKTDPNDTKKIVADLLPKTDGSEDDKFEEEESEDEEDSEEATTEKEFTLDSPVFGGKKVIKAESQKKDEPVVFEGIEKVNSFVKDKTGVENIDALVSGFSELKTKNIELQTMAEKAVGYEKIFEQLPTELYQGIDAFLKGQDWKTPILSKPALDFTKDIESHSESALVETYLPGQFTKEDWDEYNDENGDAGTKKAINLAINTAKKQYELDKKELDSFKGTKIKEAQERTEKINNSIERSVEHLKKNLEGVDENYIKQTRKNLTVQKLNELFFDKEGNFAEDAALKLTMAEHGYSMLEQYKVIAKHQAENTERQKILERTPDKPKVKKKSEDLKDSVRPEVKQAIEVITGGLGKTTIY